MSQEDFAPLKNVQETAKELSNFLDKLSMCIATSLLGAEQFQPRGVIVECPTEEEVSKIRDKLDRMNIYAAMKNLTTGDWPMFSGIITPALLPIVEFYLTSPNVREGLKILRTITLEKIKSTEAQTVTPTTQGGLATPTTPGEKCANAVLLASGVAINHAATMMHDKVEKASLGERPAEAIEQALQKASFTTDAEIKQVSERMQVFNPITREVTKKGREAVDIDPNYPLTTLKQCLSENSFEQIINDYFAHHQDEFLRIGGIVGQDALVGEFSEFVNQLVNMPLEPVQPKIADFEGVLQAASTPIGKKIIKLEG